MRALVFSTAPARLVVGLAWARLTGSPATHGLGPLRMVDLPDAPLPGKRWVRVRSLMGGICGSDLHMLRVEVSRRSGVVATRTAALGTPVYPGHEAVGEVLEVGPEVTRVETGQRVVLIPGVFCAALEAAEPCVCCREGNYSLCRRRQEKPPTMIGGGWSEQFVRHEAQVFPLREEVTDEAAAVLEPVSCSVHAVLRRPPQAGSRVLVLGAGMIGLGIVAALRALEVPIDLTVLSRHEFQATTATRLGADRTVGVGSGDVYATLAAAVDTRVIGGVAGNRYLADGFDVVYDCVGSARSLHDALRWCRPRGYVVLVGVNLFPGSLDRTPLWRREIDIVGTVGHGDDRWEGRRCTTFARAAEWIAAGRLKLEGMVTHRFAQADYREAIRTAAAKSSTGAIRVVLDFQHAG